MEQVIHEAFRYEVTGEPDAAMSGLSGSEGAGRKRTPVREQRAVLRPYLHELDRYMGEHYVHLSKSAKERRWKQRLPNYLYVRYCDDFVVLCNGTKAQATAMKEELYTFLKTRLKLELSQEKTTVTHVTDGFTFLGFRIVKEVGTSGKRVPKILIPEEAIRKFRHKIHETLAPHTHHDSVNMKIMALNRITGGWCRYYQCTSSASLMFGKLNPIVFWDMAHWLGRKFRLSMPQVMKTYYANSTFHTSTQSLIQPGNYRTKRYTSHPENNPYLTNPHQTRRETIPTMEAKVREKRPGQADLREALLARTGPICTQCGYQGTTQEMHVDHKIPRHRFKHPTEADHIGNVQILCVTCHKAKTKRLAIPIFEFGVCARGYLISPCESALSSRTSQSTKRQ
jgi:5-methylcytosine-specific restriction endonuclease McrA